MVQRWEAAYRTGGENLIGERRVAGRKWLWRIISTINPGTSVAYWLAGRRYGQSRAA